AGQRDGRAADGARALAGHAAAHRAHARERLELAADLDVAALRRDRPGAGAVVVLRVRDGHLHLARLERVAAEDAARVAHDRAQLAARERDDRVRDRRARALLEHRADDAAGDGRRRLAHDLADDLA